MRYPICCLLLLLIPTHTIKAWGFYAHKEINRQAIFLLPPEMFCFYKSHHQYLSEHAVDPDKRRYSLAQEGVRHFIDADYYERSLPFDTLPIKYEDACLKFSEDTILKYGIVPWRIQQVLAYLTKAFTENDVRGILQCSAELGHYASDANVPLHTSMNYNGQLSGQEGIHALFESRCVELFLQDKHWMNQTAQYLANPLGSTWKCISKAHEALPKVLLMELWSRDSIPDNRRYEFVMKGQTQTKVYSQTFAECYYRLLNGMVETQMKASIELVASLWYTAWVNAGQPDLERIKILNPAAKRIRKPESSENEKPEMLGRKE